MNNRKYAVAVPLLVAVGLILASCAQEEAMKTRVL